MPTNSKHIFVQVNTDAIIDISKKYEGNFPEGAQLDQTIIYDQGSMVLGSPIKELYIDVEPGQQLYITILPLMLYGYHKVYFTDFVPESPSSIINKLPEFNSHVVSFSLDVDSEAHVGAQERFGLKAVLEYSDGDGNILTIDMDIDPVLRVIQRRQK